MILQQKTTSVFLGVSGAPQGIRTPDCFEIIASGGFFFEKIRFVSKISSPPKNLTIFRETLNQRSGRFFTIKKHLCIFRRFWCAARDSNP